MEAAMPSMVLSTLEIFGISYTLWCVFIFAYVSTLKEIRKSSWHYRIYAFLYDTTWVKDTCQYRGTLMLIPLASAFWIVAGLIFYWVIVCTFIIHWAVFPLFGRRPQEGFTRSYFEELLGNGPDMSITKFGNTMPITYIVVTAALAGSVYYLYRLLTGEAFWLEYYITLGVAGFAVLTLCFIWFFTRPSVKMLLPMISEKVCLKIPVVE